MNARHELKREAETIMLAGGFTEARAEHFGPWWRVYGKLAGDNEHVGTTHLQADPQDPREMARTLVLRAKAEQIKDEPAAPETVEDTFPQGEGPFDPQPEASETPQDETHGETGEEAAAEASERDPQTNPADIEGGGGEALAVESDSEPAGGGALRDDHELAGGDPGSDAGRDDRPAVFDADFSPIKDLPEIELIPPDSDPDFGAELLEFEHDTETKEEAPTGAFIFGDNLDQKRTAAIGLVVQISLAKQEAIWADAGAHPDEFGALTSAVVRDTIDGTYRGPQTTYDRFVFLSQHDNIARRVQAVERERVTMLATATREQIETFDPEAGWP